MKKITLVCIVLLAFIWQSNSQTLNQPASWPNAAWTLSGTYAPAGLLSDPTVAGVTFTWDDDAAGGTSDDDLQATSPVIDLTSASAAGETWLTVSGDIVYRPLGGDVLAIEVYNADADTWTAVQTFVGNSTNLDYQTCANTVAYVTAVIDIAGYSATQLSGFQYRFIYDDQDGWNWGWCLTSPTIVSETPPADLLDYYNLQFPATGSISAGESFDVYAQAYEAGLTDVTAGQAPGIEAWIGYSSTDTNPDGAGWTWVPATFNGEVDNNDEYALNLGGVILGTGTYYYASRWRLNGGFFTYGGIQADASYGGVWGDDNNISGVLTVAGPPNDECSGAIDLTVNADYACGVVTSSTTLGATASPQPDDATGTPNNDVWFTFTATATGHRIVISNVVNLGGGTSISVDMGMSVFNDLAGCNMVAANEVGESDPNTLNLTGLTIGNVYYVRVYGWFTSVQNNSFDICVGSPPACDIATGLNAVPDLTTATISWTAPTSGTPAGYNWEVQPDGIAQGTAGAIDSGSTTATTDNVTGLTPNTPYDLFVQTDCGASGTSVWAGPYSFNSAANPPANDECASAVSLTPGVNYATNPVDGTVLGATSSGLTNACGGTATLDVWYTVVIPADGNITIETGPDAATANGGFDSAMQAYTSDDNTCTGTFTSVGCSDDEGTGIYSLLNLTGLTAGQNLYIRVWEFGGNETEPFSISAYNATLSIGEVNNPNAFKYFPNPVKNLFTLRAQSNIQNVSIYNMLGQEVLRTAPNNLESEINMSELQSGAYFVKVSINDIIETIRVIKQ